MEKIKIDYSKLKSLAPVAWMDIEEYYTINYPAFSTFKLESLPFDITLGIFLHYLIENGVEWDVSNTDYQLLPDTLLEILENYEKVISHYS